MVSFCGMVRKGGAGGGKSEEVVRLVRQDIAVVQSPSHLSAACIDTLANANHNTPLSSQCEAVQLGVSSVEVHLAFDR